MTTKSRLWIFVVLGLIVVVVVLAGTKGLQIKAMIGMGETFKKAGPPPESVTTAKVQATEWKASRAAIGTLVAVHSVTLASELSGSVREIFFDSGQAVHRGQDLVHLDVSVEQAQLAAAQADEKLAKQTLDRAERLRKQANNTPADLDAAASRAAATEASIAQLRATIAKKTIRAPFDGRLGIRVVELGQVLSPGTPLVSLQSVSPIYAEFWLPQQTLAELRVGMETSLVTDAYPGATWTGRISTITPEVDVATRNIRVRATFPNLDGQLRPGMFANVEVLSPDKRAVVLIPATSVLYAPYGDSIFVVLDKKGDDGKAAGQFVQQKFVRLGERRGDFVAVETGVVAGQEVVSSGAFKLRNNSAVVVKNDLAPDVQTNPHPTDR